MTVAESDCGSLNVVHQLSHDFNEKTAVHIKLEKLLHVHVATLSPCVCDLLADAV